MKKVLMIGAGIGQYYLAKKIKDRGDFLLVATLSGEYPCIPLADKVLYVNVFDCEHVLQLARMEGIDAVVSDQNDMMMPTVAYVAEHLGLPGNSSMVVNAYCNKNIFRDNCDRLGIPVPRHAAISNMSIPASMDSILFPWIVKPADSQSSVGVAKVNTIDEYYKALAVALEKSKTHTAIVEEFFHGQEIVAEGFIYKGRYYNLGFADRKYFDLSNLFIPSQTLFPSVVSVDVLNRIATCEKRMTEFMKPDFAIVHSEYLYNAESGEFRVVESALRGGGVYISSHLVPLYSGIDINDVLLDCVYGNQVDMDVVLSKRVGRASGYLCFYLPLGEIVSVKGLNELRALPFVKMLSMLEMKIGEKTHSMTHKGQRLGPILLSADNRQELEQNIEKVKKIFHVCVRDEKGLTQDIIWT